MLKLVWTPAAGVAGAPDQSAYVNAIDTLHASYGDEEATAQLPRTGPPPQIDALRDVIRRWLAIRTVSSAPVKLMLHGYDFDPRHPGDAKYDPFMLVYGYPGENGWLSISSTRPPPWAVHRSFPICIIAGGPETASIRSSCLISGRL